MLRPLKLHYPDITFQEGDYPFVETAVFADTIINMGYHFQYYWHFIDRPILNENGTSISDFPDFDMHETNNVEALGNLTNWLMDTGDYKSSLQYKYITENFRTEQDQKSFALRLIIHYCGDVHQPLHTSSVVNSTYPKGDAGGNYEKIP